MSIKSFDFKIIIFSDSIHMGRGNIICQKEPTIYGVSILFYRDIQILKKVFAKEKNNLNILFYRIWNINMLPLHVRFAKLFINFLIRSLLSIYGHVLFVLTQNQSSCGHLIWSNVRMPFGPYSKQMWCMIFVWLHLLVHKTLIATRKLMLQNILINYLFPEGS